MGIILPFVSPPQVELNTINLTFREIMHELSLPNAPQRIGRFASDPRNLPATWQEFKDLVLAGHLPRWVKEMVGVTVAATIGSSFLHQVFMQSLAVQGIHPAWLGELDAPHLDPLLLPDEIQAAIVFAREAATRSADHMDTGVLHDAGFSDDEIDELIATIGLFTRVSRATVDRSVAFPSTHRAAISG